METDGARNVRNIAPPTAPLRVVKPRKAHAVRMPIAVIRHNGEAWFEEQPEIKWGAIDLVEYLRENWPRFPVGTGGRIPIMLVCDNPHRVFLHLHAHFQNDPEWNTRFSVGSGERFHTDGTTKKPKVTVAQDIRIAYFGFRGANDKSRYFHPISPGDFMRDQRKYREDLSDLVRLYEWGGRVRGWMRKNKVRFSNSRGGLSAQLLRDKRFYPDARRKVPKRTNEKARVALPGNHYAMADESRSIFAKVFIIDQENAHHFAAKTVALPNANSLFAHGRFLVESDVPYAEKGTDLYDQLIKEHGLFRLNVLVPHRLRDPYVPPWLEDHGPQQIFLYSNEVKWAKSLGVQILSISRCWTSPNIDTGLAKYATWAEKQITAENKRWLKPVLLSAYGVLGARPRNIETAHYRSKAGEPYRYILGPVPVMMNKYVTKREIQADVANVVQRGMIEAETRKLSVELARTLTAEGHYVIAIHADGLLVRDSGNQQFPIFAKPWRIKDRLSGFKALDKVSFISDTVRCEPGRPRNG